VSAEPNEYESETTQNTGRVRELRCSTILFPGLLGDLIRQTNYALQKHEIRSAGGQSSPGFARKMKAGCPYPNSPLDFGSVLRDRVRILRQPREFLPAFLLPPRLGIAPGLTAWPIFWTDWRAAMTTCGMLIRQPGSLVARPGFASVIETAPFEVSPRGADVFEQRLREWELGSSCSPADLPIRGDIGEDISLWCRFSWFCPYYSGHPSSFFGLQAFPPYT
jgi:hypothetical protein